MSYKTSYDYDVEIMNFRKKAGTSLAYPPLFESLAIENLKLQSALKRQKEEREQERHNEHMRNLGEM